MLFVALLLLPGLIGGCPKTPQAPPGGYPDGGIDVYFSPKGGCTEAIIQQIDRAQSNIDLQAYSFTSEPIAKALLSAHKRGVKIRVILDSDQRTDKYSEADFLQHGGISTWFDAKHAIAHNKIIIIDNATLITGSFNFTKQAEQANAENVLIIQSRPQLLEKYMRNFELHLAHSQPYSR
jgi:phosphatidylserine/phosphatidylglycerophosphate/cardiolipin synthase-like enzyme